MLAILGMTFPAGYTNCGLSLVPRQTYLFLDDFRC